jgi:hypothetical protein
VGCNNSSHNGKGERLNKETTFHRIPKVKTNQGEKVWDVTKRRRMAWIAAIHRPEFSFEKVPDGARVCSAHFHSGKKCVKE